MALSLSDMGLKSELTFISCDREEIMFHDPKHKILSINFVNNPPCQVSFSKIPVTIEDISSLLSSYTTYTWIVCWRLDKDDTTSWVDFTSTSRIPINFTFEWQNNDLDECSVKVVFGI